MLRMLRATMSFRRLLAPTSNDLKLLTTAGFAFVIISVIGTAGARYLGWINETGLAALMAVLTNGFLFLVLSRLSFYSFFDNFKTPPHWALRLSMALTVAVLTMALLFVASSTSRTETCEQLHEQNGGAGLDALGIEAADFKTCLVVLSIQCVATCISAAAFTWSLGTWASECTHASTLIRCAGFGWLGTMAYTVGDIAMVCPDGQMEFWSTFLLTFGSLSSATAAVWVFLMAHVRIDSLIASSGTEVWQHDAAKAVLLFDACLVLVLTFFVVVGLQEVILPISVFFLFITAMWASLMHAAFEVFLQTLRDEVYWQPSHSWGAVECKWASNLLKIEQISLIMICLIPGLDLLGHCLLIYTTSRFTWISKAALSACNGATISVYASFSSGALLQPLPCYRAALATSSAFPPRHSSSSSSANEAWEEVVCDLAGRLLPLRDLLAFYRSLGTDAAMPHYDPAKHTTLDVVRQAIVPGSRTGDSGSDLTTVLVGAEKLRHMRHSPGSYRARMVTHCWSNLFRDLVAAVIADALHVSTWDAVAAELSLGDEGCKRLLMKMQASGELAERAVWICAFCINQHAGICGSYGPMPSDPEKYSVWDRARRDTVTGELFPLCGCNHPKYFSDSPALCEMNKFDDMMQHLRATHKDFGQIVAVDFQCHLFSRAWCLAELAEAHVEMISQHVKVHSWSSLDSHFHELSELKIEECNASVEADKQAILAKIPDLEEFNLSLQELVVGHRGMMQAWMTAQSRMDGVSRIVVRALARGKMMSEKRVEGR
eukprot:TRINITY_DN15336_c0_g1_i1.p1 TRINITY_DN15336_c0_g1~~TRINITY_DN15336_c0_g1_i1.p1  ORF type:complete len:774 (-),score=123.12 TRINITY_DN15336_c0_g1_i1:146-2467(-)